MIALHLITSTLMGLVAATSAQASGASATSAATEASAATVVQPATAPAVRIKRYCIKDRRDGAEIRPSICRTREEWRARGFDPVVAIGGI